MIQFNKKKAEVCKPIYQKADGSFLPDSSQPGSEENYEIISNAYTPHKSTRYIHVEIGSNGKAQCKNKSGEWIDTDKNLPELYLDRKECCGCFACYSACPAKAIFMRPDEEGFLYPVVDSEKCIRCYKCLSLCIFQQKENA